MPTSAIDSVAIRQFLESLGPNEGYGEELFRLYQANPNSVPEEWQRAFAGAVAGELPRLASDGKGPIAPVQLSRPAVAALAGDQVQPLRGVAARIAANMEASLGVPTATSQRSLPVRLLEENRRVINGYLERRREKISLTQLLGWALVKAAVEQPALNSAYGEAEGKPLRIQRAHVNLGLAVDVADRNGNRSLLVPAVMAAEAMNFADFAAACDRLIKDARKGRLAPELLQGVTLSFTNPGTLGTRASVPRLVPGQGAIIAAGAVAYPAGFEGMPEETLYSLGIGRVLTLSCTYDHRIIQGAESGAFLARVHEFLLGADGFYERIFADLRIPFHPVRWSVDASPLGLPGASQELVQARKQAAVFQLVHAFRVRGHLMADTDPLGFHPLDHPELDPQHYGLTLWDLDRRFTTSLISGRDDGSNQTPTLRDILEVLRFTYCGPIACEFMHIQRLEERSWLQERMEPARNHWPLSLDLRRRALELVTRAEAFERLLHTRFVGHKRFSLEGAEALIPALDHLLNLAADGGAGEVLLGMAHRGRLNVLCGIVGQGMNQIFSRFEDADPNSVEGSGDVKYHIGAEGTHRTPSGKDLAVTLIPNPSHLEAVDPVLEGATRARQTLLGDISGRLALPVLIHGDAAFAGQGVVVETLNLSQLEGYRTGGTIHFVINNRIGFTTSPSGARSSLYCTDVARTVQAPIFHVNGDDPEALLRAVALAYGYRQQFAKDVVIDLVCYRRHGHNEGDDPSLTQPVLYRRIESHPSVRAVYAARLEHEGVLDAGAGEDLYRQAQSDLSAAAEAPLPAENGAEPETRSAPAEVAAPLRTAVDEARLLQLGEALTTLPPDFHLHPKLRGFLDKRAHVLAERGAVDWSLAEALALGASACDGIPVRLTGQDTGRGTFSQRHAILYDHLDGHSYTPLRHLGEQAKVHIYDSLLSEEAALGFEFGYAMTHTEALVIWEAQFGDFANGAQVIIDQFLAASLAKWGRTCGLVLLLPHGYEGQGPEHSSARLERFLQLCADDNLQIANCTTAAQYFHVLRRQALLPRVVGSNRRRPLILFTPKSFLRAPEVASPLAELSGGAFQPLIADPEVDLAQARRIVFCTGKIYHELRRVRQQAARQSQRPESAAGTALLRIELLNPFPTAASRAAIARCTAAQTWIWAQEEPKNMGAWNFVRDHLQALLPPGQLEYVGRDAAASPATGSLRRHQEQQAYLLQTALNQ